MNINLTNKQRSILEEQKINEELCIKKYNNYANQAKDSELKHIFLHHASQEEDHLNSLNQMLNGQVPTLNEGEEQSQQQNSNTQNSTQSNNSSNSKTFDKNDADLCRDLLNNEKYVSESYNSAIFEFCDTSTTDVLNHIQKEEQHHGQDIYNYMISHGISQ